MMTKHQYHHFLGFIRSQLPTSDFFVVGGQGWTIVFPDITILLRPRDSGPCAMRNRYFSISYVGSNVARRHEQLMNNLSAATQRYAEEFPWILQAVRDGRVFLENSSRVLRYLLETPGSYRTLFSDFEAIRSAGDAAHGSLGELFDFDALGRIVFEIASAASHDRLNPIPHSGDIPKPETVLEVPDRTQPVFINLLQGTGALEEELRLWTSTFLGKTCLDASNWHEVGRGRTEQTVVFCFGEHDECANFLLKNVGKFRHVAFVDPIGSGLLAPLREIATKDVSVFRAMNRRLDEQSLPVQPLEQRLSYVPVVSRNILYHRLDIAPSYDFFVCANCEQDMTFLLRHEKFFSDKKIMIGTKPCTHQEPVRASHERKYLDVARKIRLRLPNALFTPRVPQYLHLYLWQMARNVVVMFPNSWEEMSYTLATALLSGRGVVTSPHPGVSQIDPACLLFYDQTLPYEDDDLSDRFCDDQASMRAARHARRFAETQLEFAHVAERIVRLVLQTASRSNRNPS